MVSFNVTKFEREMIHRIANRAIAAATQRHEELILRDVMIDVTACHCNGCVLNLSKLCEADDFNFAHDIGGILRHIDRKTGKLTGNFVPRFAALKGVGTT